jgi:hypothetical protein
MRGRRIARSAAVRSRTAAAPISAMNTVLKAARTKLSRKTATANGPIHLARAGSRIAQRLGPRIVQARMAGPVR